MRTRCARNFFKKQSIFHKCNSKQLLLPSRSSKYCRVPPSTSLSLVMSINVNYWALMEQIEREQQSVYKQQINNKAVLCSAAGESRFSSEKRWYRILCHSSILISLLLAIVRGYASVTREHCVLKNSSVILSQIETYGTHTECSM